jgi:hypothetical protein
MGLLDKVRAVTLGNLSMVVVACGPAPAIQQAPGSISSSTFPSAHAPAAQAPVPMATRAQAKDAFRWAYAMDTANKAAQLGTILGGPYGGPAGMGMGVLGLLYGVVTAEAKLAEEEMRAQGELQKEAAKDDQLEAAIEKELARQRSLQIQIAGSASASANVEMESGSTRALQPTSTPAADHHGVAVASLPRAAAPAPFKNLEIKDLNNDGTADLWIYYSPHTPGEVLRQEESSRMDGRVDTWSYYKDGKLVRRDVDHRGEGRPDAVYFYDAQKIVREERDEAGQGRMTYRADYRDGRLTRVERETRGSGRPDLWVTYDTAMEGEIILKEERDLNGDGFPDLSSHYDRGRLVRRDVNAVGLEILATYDDLPDSPNGGWPAALVGK